MSNPNTQRATHIAASSRTQRFGMPPPPSGIELERKQTICLDFDGVVHSYTSPWTTACTIPDPPVPGAFEFIEQCLDAGYAIAIFSTRSHQPGGIEAIFRWLRDHKCRTISFIQLPEIKPPAVLYIDDRGWLFSGTFPTIEQIRAFKPWNKGGVISSGREVFELVDNSDDETYYPIGIFPSLEAAIQEVDKIGADCNKLGPATEMHEEYIKVEIRQRPFGFSEIGEKVWSREYERDCGENNWRITQTRNFDVSKKT